MKPASVSVLDGSTFAVSDAQGDIQADTEDVLGLFWNDMRHLSRWQLRLNGRPLQALSTDSVGYDEAVFFLVVPTGTIYRNPRLSVLRRRRVCDGLREQVTISNHTAEPVLLELSLLFDADFADIFEVKDHLSKQGSLSSRVEPGGVVLGYRHGDFRRETHIRVQDHAWCTSESITFQLELAPQGTWHTEIEVVMGSGGRRHPTKPRRQQPNIDRPSRTG
jgi:N-terminal domain of (some) glycogen debranching enzymes